MGWPVECACSGRAEVAMCAFCTALDAPKCAVSRSYRALQCMSEGSCRECGTLHLSFLVGGLGP